MAPLLTAMLASGWVSPTAAAELTLDGWQGRLDTTVTVGSSWRVQNPDHKLIFPGNAVLVGIGNGRGGSMSDGGDLNYRAGDRFSTVAKFRSKLALHKGKLGGAISIRGWYDEAQLNEDAVFGNQTNGYQTDTPLSDDGFDRLQKYKGLRLWDAYLYNTFNIADRPLTLRVGRQTLDWGTSMFVPGIKYAINPVDVPALHRPGTKLKNELIPTGMLYTKLSLGQGVSVDGFYQFEWQPTPLDSCGSYMAVTETILSSSAAGCDMAVALGANTKASYANGIYIPLVDGRDASNGGQGGLGVHFPLQGLHSKMSLYAINIHSRTPYVSAYTGQWRAGHPAGAPLNPLEAHVRAGAAVTAVRAFWEYPEDTHIFALTTTTKLKGLVVRSELSYSPNTPAQRNPVDMVAAAVKGVGPLGAQVRRLSPNSYVKGYDRFDRTQFQVNALKVLPGLLGASRLILAAELATEFNSVPENNGRNIRYGRGFIFGLGSTPALNTCGSANANPNGCQNDGYISDFSWGYRLYGKLIYRSLFGSELSMTPSVYLAQDVKGVSMGHKLQEGRLTVRGGVGFVYKASKVGINYTWFADAADYNPLRDRDYASVSYSYSF